MTHRALCFALCLAVAVAVPVAAQAVALEKGIELGANFANFRGEFADFADTKGRLGFVGGPFVALRVAPDLAVEAQVLFSMKGAKMESELIDEGGNPRGTLKTFINVTYLEVPLLLRASFLPAARVQPMLYLGPTLGFTLSGRIHTDRLGDAELTDLKPVDVGVAFGGGASTRLGGQRLIVDFRYTTGFTDIYHVDIDIFGARAESINNVFSLMVGIGF